MYNGIKKLTYNIISYILNLGFHNNYLLCCTGDSGSLNNIVDNIYYFSDDNSDNGSTSNSTDNSENDRDSTSNSNDNSENNSENNENFNNNNSNGDLNPDYDSDDPIDQDCIEVEDHNGPEEVINDLEIIDRAKKNDPVALEYLKEEYGSFFDKNSTEEALKEIEDYLENSFPSELKKSEHEADALEAKENAKNIEEGIKKLEKEAEETTDPQTKENLSKGIEYLKERAQEELEKGEKSEAKAMGRDLDHSSEEDEEGKNNNSKHPKPEEEEEKKNKRQKLNNDRNDDDDGNSSSDGTGPLTTDSDSDSGSSNLSGGNLSKVLVILGGILETISKILEDINIM